MFNTLFLNILICETLGTFFITACINLTCNNNNEVYNAFLVPGVVTLLVFLFGPITKAFFNSVIVLMDLYLEYFRYRNLPIIRAIVYTCAHLIGVWLAMLLTYLAGFNLTVGPQIAENVTQLKAFTHECFCTFLIGFYSLFFWDKNFKAPPRILGASIFGGIIFIAITICGPLTGACMNPTIFFGIKCFRFFINGNSDEFKDFPQYLIATLSGGFLSLIIYQVFYEKFLEDLANKRSEGETISPTVMNRKSIEIFYNDDPYFPMIDDKSMKLNKFKKFEENFEIIQQGK